MMNLRILLVLLSLALTSSAYAQECATFFPFEKGAQMEYTSYNKRGKVESITDNTIEVIDQTDNTLKAVVATVLKDKKGKETFSGTYEVLCQDGKLLMDVNAMLNPQMTEAFSGYEVTVEGDALTLPYDLEVGMSLPDASSRITTSAEGINLVSMTVNITDRAVEDKATITTDAGTFECYKIRQTSNIKMMINRSYTTVEYYAEGVGMVRSETYDKRDKLQSYMELTAFQK